MKKKDFNEKHCYSGKQCLSAKEAGDVVNGLKHHFYGHSAQRIPKRKYWCVLCGSWHLTHFSVCKVNRAKQFFEQKRRAFLEYESEKEYREETLDYESYRLSKW